MSNRALAWLAFGFSILLLASVSLLLQRKGYFARWGAEPLVYTNHTLLATRGQRAVLRPIHNVGPSRRYWVATTITEPESDDPVLVYPHVRAGIEEREPNRDQWLFTPPVRAVAIARGGALLEGEFLSEIRHVEEVAIGGERRTLVRATYGDMKGASVIYYYDPKAPTPLFGWIRRERRPTDQPVEILFAADGGVKTVEKAK